MHCLLTYHVVCEGAGKSVVYWISSRHCKGYVLSHIISLNKIWPLGSVCKLVVGIVSYTLTVWCKSYWSSLRLNTRCFLHEIKAHNAANGIELSKIHPPLAQVRNHLPKQFVRSPLSIDSVQLRFTKRRHKSLMLYIYILLIPAISQTGNFRAQHSIAMESLWPLCRYGAFLKHTSQV